MDFLTLALQVALVLVIVATLYELLRLRRAVQLAQLALPDIDEIRKLEKSIRTAVGEVQGAARAFASAPEESRVQAEPAGRGAEGSRPEEPGPVDRPVEVETPRLEDSPRRGPRVLSEAGRAKYDRVLHMAAQGLDIDSIAAEVDLTRAEVELMLGSAS